MSSTPYLEGCVVLSTVTTFAPGGGYVGTNEGDSLLVLAAVQGPQNPAAGSDAWLHESSYSADVYVMNYRLHECGWIPRQKLNLCKLPQWDLGLAIATNGALMVQLILRDSLGKNMLENAWRQYEWPLGLTFYKKETAMRNGAPTAIHMSLSTKLCDPVAYCVALCNALLFVLLKALACVMRCVLRCTVRIALCNALLFV